MFKRPLCHFKVLLLEKSFDIEPKKGTFVGKNGTDFLCRLTFPFPSIGLVMKPVDG